jgi:putative transposase
LKVLHRRIECGQYTSIAFGERCKKMGVRRSMGTVGDAYDNAMAESFFATLECELIDRRSFQSTTEARRALFSYIEGWYNPRRRHSALGYQSPIHFERMQTNESLIPAPIANDGFPTAGRLRVRRTQPNRPAVENPAPLTA